MWTPTRPQNGEGCMDREETRAGTRNSPTNEHLIRSTGVVSTACREGDLRSVREARDWLGGRGPKLILKVCSIYESATKRLHAGARTDPSAQEGAERVVKCSFLGHRPRRRKSNTV